MDVQIVGWEEGERNEELLSEPIGEVLFAPLVDPWRASLAHDDVPELVRQHRPLTYSRQVGVDDDSAARKRRAEERGRELPGDHPNPVFPGQVPRVVRRAGRTPEPRGQTLDSVVIDEKRDAAIVRAIARH